MFAALLLALPASAQTYPDELWGERVDGGGELVSILSEARWCPYSFPIDRDLGFIGNWASSFDQFEISYICLATVRGYYCVARAPADFVNGVALPWNEGAHCYLSWDLRPDGLINFRAVVLLEGRGTLYEGCFEAGPGHPLPVFKFSSECTLLISDLYNADLPERAYSENWVEIPKVR